MRSLPLSVANPKTAAQVTNRNRFKACAQFASLILASIIIPLMDRFAGQMSGYNFFTKLNKDVWAFPTVPQWDNLIISKGKMISPDLTDTTVTTSGVNLDWSNTREDRYGLPTDKVYALVLNQISGRILFQGDTGATRSDETHSISFDGTQPSTSGIHVYVSFLRADGTEVSNSTHFEAS
jgi:hypothetical protein